MPHVVIDKKINLLDFSKHFEPVINKETILIKLQDIFVNKNNDTALIRTLVIDSLHQDFFIELDASQERTTVRLFPRTDPEKTVGVKTAIGLVVLALMSVCPDAKIIKTNISEYIPKRVINLK